MRVLYILMNPSDPYTFYAPNIAVAGVAVAMISTNYGAKPAEGDGASSPMIFGWDRWMAQQGIDTAWMVEHGAAIADALDSLLIGEPAQREELDQMWLSLPVDERHAWRENRQREFQSSVNCIAARAYALSNQIRDNLAVEEAP